MDLKTIGAIAAFLLGSGGLVWKLNDMNKQDAYLIAKDELRKEYDTKYEKIVDANLRYKFVCGCDSL